MTPADLANVALLRNLQSEVTASLNAIVWRISDIRPSAEQWATLWPALEAANRALQVLTDELAAAHTRVKQQRRRLRDVGVSSNERTEAPKTGPSLSALPCSCRCSLRRRTTRPSFGF